MLAPTVTPVVTGAAPNQLTSLESFTSQINEGFGAIAPNVRKLNTEATRAPLPTDDASQGYEVGSRWLWQGQEWVASNTSRGSAEWGMVGGEALEAAQNAAQAGIPYTTRDNFLAANVPLVVTRSLFFVNGYTYAVVRDASGPIVQANGQTWRPDGEVTPYHFGAKGDNEANDSPAFQAMFDWVMREGGWEEIYLPKGQFVIETRITSAANPAPATSLTRGLRVRGAGAGCVIVNKNAEGFFAWLNLSARNIRAHMTGFSVEMANGGNNGTIIELSQVPGGIARVPAVMIEYVHIFPRDRLVDYYTQGIKIIGCFWPRVYQCTVANPFGPNVTTATQHQGEVGINVDECYGPQVVSTKVWGAARGFSYDVQSNPGGEGGLIDDCVFDSKVGAYIRAAGKEPGFDIIATHFNCAEKSIHLINKKLCNIRDCLVYSEELGPFVDIDIENSEDITVRNMRFHFTGNPNRTHIRTDINCHRIFIEQCKHRANAVAMDLHGQQIFVTEPHFETMVTTQIIDRGVAGLFVKNIRPYFAQRSLSAPQSIPDITETAVAWDVNDGNFGFGAAPSSTITIPANMGIRRVRLTVQTRWGNNSTGQRAVRFTKNGAAFAGGVRSSKQANGLTYDTITCDVDCTDGDVFRALVSQTSGVAQNFGALDVFFRVEAT